MRVEVGLDGVACNLCSSRGSHKVEKSNAVLYLIRSASSRVYTYRAYKSITLSVYHSVKSVDLYNIKLCSYIPSPILRCFLSTTDSSLWYKDLIAKLPHTAHCMSSSWSRSPLF